jgi:NADH-quinone oxidoreductase subunit L
MKSMITQLILIPALPLLAAIITAVLGPKVLRERSHWPTILALGAACLLSLSLLLDVGHSAAAAGDEGWAMTTGDLWTWANIVEGGPGETPADFNIGIVLRIDPLTGIMLAMVTFVATLIAIYSAGYMHGDRSYWRFFTYLSLFAFSMTMLVSVSNFLLLYVFWEAVGVCSYLLIGFWYEKPEAAAAGKKAFLVNRVGDFGFAIALFLIWTIYGTLNFHDVIVDDAVAVMGVLGQSRLAQPDLFVGGGVGLAICLLLLVGACGKSAQFPLHVWLPDAMEGPTPVSALIHAATMVTAGIYMITRCLPLFLVSETAQIAVATIGATTALLGAFIAFTQTDLKRVLAYSTISQLGFMFLGLGIGTLAGAVAGMFHLFTHAFFKALLFLGAGSVMHAMGGVIDVRRFGGLRRLMPITHWTFLFGCLALAGVFPFAGFWSKDQILHLVHLRGHDGGWWLILYYTAKVTALMTAIYTFRAFFLTFYGEEQIPPEAGHHAHESPGSMTAPLVVLAACALGVGFLNESFAGLIAKTPSLAYAAEASAPAYEALHTGDIIWGTLFALVGVALAAFLYLGDRKEVEWITIAIKPIYSLSYGKVFIDPIYNALIVLPLKGLAALAYFVDRYVVDGIVNLCGRVPLALGGLLRFMQTGLLQFYAMLMVLGLLVLFGSLFL